MVSSSLRLSLMRDSIEGLLRCLATLPPSPEVEGLRTKAEDYLGQVGRWNNAPPTPQVSQELMRRVLKLHVRAAALEREGAELITTVYGVRIEQVGLAIEPAARLILDWPAPPRGAWKIVGLRVTEEASAFDLVEASAGRGKLTEIPIPCAVFAPHVQPWELDALSPTVPREVDIVRPTRAVRFSEHALVVGSRLRLKVENRHRGKALHFRAALFVREL